VFYGFFSPDTAENKKQILATNAESADFVFISDLLAA
jgi:hypothetical protein